VVRRLQPECLQFHGAKSLGNCDRLGGEGMVAKEDRGFASMDRNKQREIASKGGKAAHQKGTAHEWTSEEAREAGRKGGMASHRRKQQQQQPAEESANPAADTSPIGNDFPS
jgi:general stress protein YciG